MARKSEEELANWTKRSSDSEQEKQDRTERMIKQAIDAHDAFSGYNFRVYAKGSYANNTNVRADSDVDIAVQCQEVFYDDEEVAGVANLARGYAGVWTPQYLRSELKKALEKKFPGQVDSSSSTAFQIESGSARVQADVVPCFDYRYYFKTGNYVEGARVFKTDGTKLTNYPDQQLKNGRVKNNETNRYYKRTVRILKRVENAMAADGYHRELPSYFMECLGYNVPNYILTLPTWTETVRGAVAYIYSGLKGAEPSSDRWLEPNERKYLFAAGQPWTRTDGRDFAYAIWNYLELKQ